MFVNFDCNCSDCRTDLVVSSSNAYMHYILPSEPEEEEPNNIKRAKKYWQNKQKNSWKKKHILDNQEW